MLSSEQQSTSESIAEIAFGGLTDHKHHVRCVMVREIGDTSIELWHALDVSDFSTFRSFVVTGSNLYDVDFLSRHEIVAPMSIDKLPAGWQSWATVHGNQLIVIDKAEFCGRMMTPDAVVALPTYRFDFFTDDVRAEVANGFAIQEAIERVLESLVTGYSYNKYDGSFPEVGPVLMFSLEGRVPQ